MRRKDKRTHDIECAADGPGFIKSTKGMRTMNSQLTGRFAADMRFSKGGYGRVDTMYGLDHPWHQTNDDLFQQLCEKDGLENGERDRLEKCDTVHATSRASLRRMKRKKKKTSNGVLKNNPDKEGNGVVKDMEPGETKAMEKIAKLRAAKKEEKARKLENLKAGVVVEPKLSKREKKEAQRMEERQMEVKELLKEESAEKVAHYLDNDTVVALEKLYAAEKLGTAIKTETDLVLTNVKLGHGKMPSSGEMVTVKYRGFVGEELNRPFAKGMMTTIFNSGSVIAGWEEGLATMRPGGVRVLEIPPKLAYGAEGKGDKIPPNATLKFHIELVRIGKRKRSKPTKPDEMPLPNSFSVKCRKT